VNEVRLRLGRIVREGLRTTLSELRLRKDSPSSRKRWLSLCGRPALFIVGRERAKLGYFWRHAYNVPQSGPYLGCVVNSDTGMPVILDEGRLTAAQFEQFKISETIDSRSDKPCRPFHSPLWQADADKLIAYASGYLKCHYLAAFTAGLLNAQPMGFYAPSVLIKDAQEHGLQVKPIDILRSEWDCILEQQNEEIVLWLGFRYVRKLREESARAIVAARQQAGFEGIPDFTRRVPVLRRDELQNLAVCGALNPLDHKNQLHRRDALWQVTKFGMPTGPLFKDISDYDPTSILLCMTDMERLITDHHISGFTIGRHAMAYRREDLNRMHLSTLHDARNSDAGEFVKTAGEVTVTQRPGTAKGIMFMTLHDETGYCDVVIKPAVYREYQTLIKKSRFLRVQGKLQKVENAKERGAFVVSINATQLFALDFPKIETRRRHAH